MYRNMLKLNCRQNSYIVREIQKIYTTNSIVIRIFILKK